MPALNPYLYELTLHSHNGVHVDPSSGVRLGFTVKASVELVRRARTFLGLHRHVTGSQIGPYSQTGRSWLKRFAGHVAASDAALSATTEAYLDAIAASGVCLALLNRRAQPSEVNLNHPWVKGTVELLAALERTSLKPGQREALFEKIIEKFRLAQDASRAALERHRERTGPESSHTFVRSVTLMHVRIAAAEQIGKHFKFSIEETTESLEVARLVLQSLTRRKAKQLAPGGDIHA